MTIVATGSISIIDVNDTVALSLTQSSYMVATATDGSGGNFSGALTTASVVLGTSDDSTAWTFSAVAGPGVTGNLVLRTYRVTALSNDTGFVDILATRSGFPDLTARFSLAKARQGANGVGMALIPSAVGFTFVDGVASPASQTIAITAVRQSNAPVSFFASNGAALDTDQGVLRPWGVPIVGDGSVCYVTEGDLGAAEQMYITAVCGSATQVLGLTRINRTTAVAGATRNVFRGAWSLSGVYLVGDSVTTLAGAWVALVDHVATGPNAPPTAPATSNAWWQTIASNIITSSAQIGNALINNAHITQIDAGKANIGIMNARHLEVTESLVIDSVTGALVLGKDSAFDTFNDGIFMGRTEESPGVAGFGFVAGKDIGGIPQYLQITSQTGYKSVNARHYVTGVTAPTLVDVTASQTITLPAGTKLISLQVLGGGGGGAGGTTISSQVAINATTGGATTVQLWDGVTNTGISWTSAGGLRSTTIHADDSGWAGGSSALGSGGAGGAAATVGGNGGNGSGYGSGGGGGGGTEKGGDGGSAAILNSILDYDVSALTTPKLVVTIGAGGAGSAGQDQGAELGGDGGAGAPGILKYAARTDVLVPANVLPLQPTFTGTMTKADNAVVTFPNYGAGLWVICVFGGSGGKLSLGNVETHVSGAYVRLWDGCTATFISDKTPVDLSVSALAVTYEYNFYKLSEWV